VNQFDVRVDHNLRTEATQIFGRYSYMNTERHEPPVLDDAVASGDFSSDIFNKGQSAVGSWSRVLGGSMFNEFRGVVEPDCLGLHASSRSASIPMRSTASGRAAGPALQWRPAALRRSPGGANRGPFFRPQDQTSQVFQFAESSPGRRVPTTTSRLERRRDIVDYVDLRALNGS